MQAKRVTRHLPFSLLATTVVVVVPALVVARMGGWGIDLSLLTGIALCVALSLLVGSLAAAAWQHSSRSREILFADLMLWGWVRRVVTERRLARAQNLVEGAASDDQRVRALARVSTMLDARDAYTRSHSLRVTRYSEAIARELDLPEDEVARVRKAAALHDVGKLFTPREVLNKPARLSDAEFTVMKRHPGAGADLLHGVVEPEVEAMIRHHHERLGGSGYPDGLVGDAIPLGARIIAVADTFDAITSTRSYRAARPHTNALAVLREESGTALDAGAVRAFSDYYFGSRTAVWTGIASGLTQTLGPLRELLTPVTRALPAIGASAAITAPILIAGGAGGIGADRGRDGAAPSPDVIAAAPLARPAARTPSSDVSRRLTRAIARTRTAEPRTTTTGRRPVPGASAPGSTTPGAPNDPGSPAPTAIPSATPTSAPPDDPAPETHTAPVPTATPAAAEPESTATPGAAGNDGGSLPTVQVPALAVPDLPVELPDVELTRLPELP